MRKLFIVTIIVFASLAGRSQCNDELLSLAINQMGEDFDYVKDIKIRLKKSKKGKTPLSIKQGIILNKGQTYKIYARNAKEYDGRIIFQLHNVKGNIAKSYSNGTHFKAVTYKCTATGMYYLSSYYENGEEGCSVVVIAVKPTKHEINKFLE